MRVLTPRHTRTSSWVSRLTLLSLLAAVSPSRADDGTRAEELLDQGKKRMLEPGGLAEACQILEESFKLAERGDTLLNLAECHRRQGKTASAWNEFDRAIPEGEKFKFVKAIAVAKQMRDELAVRLSMLTVTVPETTAALDQLTIQVNGKVLPRDRWNSPHALDPGPFEITATAAGHRPFSSRIELGPDRDRKNVLVTLEAEPPPAPPPASSSAPPPPPPPPPTPPPPLRTAPVWPWIVGGTGLALGAVAVIFAVDQSRAGQELDDRCGAGRKKCPASYDFSSARSRELRDFGLFVGLGALGVAGVATGAIALGLGPRGQTATLHLGPGQLSLRGQF